MYSVAPTDKIIRAFVKASYMIHKPVGQPRGNEKIIIYTNALKQPFDIAEIIEDLSSFCLVKQIMVVVGLLLASKMGNDIAQPYIFFVAFILRARM